MNGLRELLLEELLKIKEWKNIVERRLMDAPRGHLRLSSTKHYTQFYFKDEKSSGNGMYIPKGNEDLINKLAQKEYDEKVLNKLNRRISQFEKILKDYRDDEIERIYYAEHAVRQKMIVPVSMTWEQRVTEWLSIPYQGKAFSEEAAMILTNRNERVRSKSEKILADYFISRGLFYKYECPLYLPGYGYIYPDFTFLSRQTGEEVYLEHEGMMDDANYARSAVRKIELYEKNGIYPGERLFLTFETSQSGLNMKIIEDFVNRYLA